MVTMFSQYCEQPFTAEAVDVHYPATQSGREEEH